MKIFGNFVPILFVLSWPVFKIHKLIEIFSLFSGTFQNIILALEPVEQGQGGHRRDFSKHGRSDGEGIGQRVAGHCGRKDRGVGHGQGHCPSGGGGRRRHSCLGLLAVLLGLGSSLA